MQQFFIAIILVLGISTYWLYTTNQTLAENNMKLEACSRGTETSIGGFLESLTRNKVKHS